MPKIKLTDSFIRNFSYPGKEHEFYDEIRPGFILRVTKTGHKSFSYRYRFGDKVQRYTIGTFPAISLSKARSIADDLHLKVKQGIDPQEEKLNARAEPRQLTISELSKEYEDRHFLKLKKTTQDDYRRRINNVIVPALGDIYVKDLDRITIIDFLEEIAFEHGKDGAPIQSNRVRAVLSSMYSFAVDKAICDFNPVQTVKPIGEEKSRNRVYSEKEIKLLWEHFCFETEPFSSVFKMLLITGQRLRETRRMKWKHLKNDIWIIPEEETKASRTHFVPLSTLALKILEERKEISGDSDFVFESPVNPGEPIYWLQNAAARIRRASKIDDFRIHDLRRTVASFMAEQGVSRTVLGKILNHKGLSGDSSVTAIYDRHEYMDEKKEALDSWANQIDCILTGEKEKI